MTVGYLVLVIAFVELFGLPPAIAGPVAFLLCLPLAYWGQSSFVFRARSDHRRQALRFGVTMLCGFVLLTAAPIVGAWLNLPYQINILFGVAFVPAVNYMIFYLWVFPVPRAMPVSSGSGPDAMRRSIAAGFGIPLNDKPFLSGAQLSLHEKAGNVVE